MFNRGRPTGVSGPTPKARFRAAARPPRGYTEFGRGPQSFFIRRRQATQGARLMYHGIDLCDNCGEPLEEGKWLSGLCQSYERGVEAAKRMLET